MNLVGFLTGTDASPQPESAVAQQSRIAWEALAIAEADAQIEAGLMVDAADIHAWVESIGTDHELPPPPERHR